MGRLWSTDFFSENPQKDFVARPRVSSTGFQSRQDDTFGSSSVFGSSSANRAAKATAAKTTNAKADPSKTTKKAREVNSTSGLWGTTNNLGNSSGQWPLGSK
jgi:hypothetical protein